MLLLLALKMFGGDEEESKESSEPQIVITEEAEPTVEYTTMPDVKGINIEDAKKSLTALGLKVEIAYEESDTVDEGVVMNTNISAKTELQVGSTVTLTVSSGTKGVEVPEVSGYTFDEANSRLVNLGFLVNKVEAYSDTIEAGIVVSQMPLSGNKAPKGSVITITVSLGKEETKIRVPNFIGMSEEDATIEAIELGLTIGSITGVYSDTVEIGKVCYQSFSHGSYVDPETPIDIKVSLGNQAVTYKCNASITAPTVEEAPGYVTGTEVSIKLVTDDGNVLLDTKTTTFPQAANYFGLAASGGTLTMSYEVTTEGTTTTNPETGETVNVPGTKEVKSFTRRIEFVKE